MTDIEKTAPRRDETGHLLVEQDQQIQNLLKQLQILVSRYPDCATVITFKEMTERSDLGVVVATPVENGIEFKVRQR